MIDFGGHFLLLFLHLAQTLLYAWLRISWVAFGVALRLYKPLVVFLTFLALSWFSILRLPHQSLLFLQCSTVGSTSFVSLRTSASGLQLRTEHIIGVFRYKDSGYSRCWSLEAHELNSQDEIAHGYTM